MAFEHEYYLASLIVAELKRYADIKDIEEVELEVPKGVNAGMLGAILKDIFKLKSVIKEGKKLRIVSAYLKE